MCLSGDINDTFLFLFLFFTHHSLCSSNSISLFYLLFWRPFSDIWWPLVFHLNVRKESKATQETPRLWRELVDFRFPCRVIWLSCTLGKSLKWSLSGPSPEGSCHICLGAWAWLLLIWMPNKVGRWKSLNFHQVDWSGRILLPPWTHLEHPRDPFSSVRSWK